MADRTSPVSEGTQHQALAGGLLQPGAFATMFYGLVDPHANCITYAAAGSPPPLIRRARGLPLTALDSTGLPLGITVDADYACFKVAFEPGGMLFLYSDIFIHLTDGQGTRAGEAGACQQIQACADEATAEAAVERIRRAVLRSTGQAAGR